MQVEAAGTRHSVIAETFRKRAISARRQAYFVLSVVCIMLIAAIAIFVFAGDLTKSDVGSRVLYKTSDDVKKKIKEIEESLPEQPKFLASEKQKQEYEKLIERMSSLREEVETKLRAVEIEVESDVVQQRLSVDRGTVLLSEVIKDFVLVTFSRELSEYRRSSNNVRIFTSSKLHYLEKIKKKSEVKASLQLRSAEMTILAKEINANRGAARANYERGIDEWKKETRDSRRELGSLENGLFLMEENEEAQKFGLAKSNMSVEGFSTPLLVQTNITRFGPMLIILFFTSILVNLYRYSIRLAAYYDARADAVELIGTRVDVETFNKYLDGLSPESHDVGKPPKMPTDHFADVVKTLIGKAKLAK